MITFEIRPINDNDRSAIADILKRHWGTATLITYNRIHHADRLPGFIATQDGKIAGLATCNINQNECELVSLNSLSENIGIGTALLDAVKEAAASAGCHRLYLITTNDNTPALRFYQKRGYTISAVRLNQLEESRKLKPEIPLTGVNGIPIRDEIELELIL